MRLVDLDTDAVICEAIPGAIIPGGTPPPAPGVAPTTPPQPGQSGQPGQQVDPAVAALAVKQKQDQKKQIQDQIRATEKQLQELRKQLAQIR